MSGKPHLIDTNVIIRYLVEDPDQTQEKFKGVFVFFSRVEAGETSVELCELVLFETFFVLTRTYKVPPQEAARQLEKLIAFKGVVVKNKSILRSCLRILQKESLDLVDAYLLATARQQGAHALYSFDSDLSRKGLTLLEVS